MHFEPSPPDEQLSEKSRQSAGETLTTEAKIAAIRQYFDEAQLFYQDLAAIADELDAVRQRLSDLRKRLEHKITTERQAVPPTFRRTP